MKKITCRSFIAVITLLFWGLSAFAQGYVYTDATSLPVFGKVSHDTDEPFSRLPASLKDVSRDAVWRLGRCSAGEYVRFRSDAGEFRLEWTSTFRNEHTNMAPSVASGLSLYVLDGDAEEFAKGNIVQLSKEFVRQYYRETGYHKALYDAREKGEPEPDIPALPQDIVDRVSKLYVDMYERITGEKF